MSAWSASKSDSGTVPETSVSTAESTARRHPEPVIRSRSRTPNSSRRRCTRLAGNASARCAAPADRGSGVNRRGTFTSSRCTCRYPLFAALRRAIRVPVIAASSSSAVRIGPPGSRPLTSSGASATGASGTDRYSQTDPSVPCTRPSRFRARTVVGQSGSPAPLPDSAVPRRSSPRPLAGWEPVRHRWCHPAGPLPAVGGTQVTVGAAAGGRRGVPGDGVAVRDQGRAGARAAPGDHPGRRGVRTGDQHVEGGRRRRRRFPGRRGGGRGLRSALWPT